MRRNCPRVDQISSNYLCSLLILLIGSASALLVVESPEEFSQIRCRTTLISPWKLDYEFYNDTNPDESVVVSNVIESSSKSSNARNGSIVMRYNTVQGISIFIHDELLRWQREGASAVILFTTYPHPGRAVWKILERYKTVEYFRREIRIPVFQVTEAECQSLNLALANDPSLTVQGILYAQDAGNPFLESSKSIGSAVFQGIVLLTAVVSIAFTIRKLSLILQASQFSNKLPPIVLIFQILGSLLMALFAVDPWGMRLIFDPFTHTFLLTPHFAIVLICDIIVLYYWNVSLRSYGSRRIQKSRKLMIGICCVIAYLEVAFSTLRAFEIQYVAVVTILVLYTFVQGIIIFYITYAAIGLRRYFSKWTVAPERGKDFSKLVLMTKILILIAIIIFIMAVFTILAATLIFFQSNEGQMVAWGVVNSLLGLNMIATSFVFDAKTKSVKVKVFETHTAINSEIDSNSLKSMDSSISLNGSNSSNSKKLKGKEGKNSSTATTFEKTENASSQTLPSTQES